MSLPAAAGAEPAQNGAQSGRGLVRAAGRALAAALLAVVCVGAWGAALLPLAEHAVITSPPDVPRPVAPIFPLLRDARPVRLTVTEAWRKLPLEVEADDVRRDPTLWNRMNFDDWDRVPQPLRGEGLDRLVARYARAVSGPEVWQAMTPEAWDVVPQPVRAMAFLRIAEYWAGQRAVGTAWGLDPREAGDTLAALVMVESWFEHRATTVDVNGNRDLGLAQASDYCRDRLAALHRQGRLDFSLAEADYFDPWFAVLAGAAWLDLMIDEARGDLDLAVRAYRKGIGAARRGEAADYAENVVRKKDRFVRNRGAPPAWDALSRRLRQVPASRGAAADDGRALPDEGRAR